MTVGEDVDNILEDNFDCRCVALNDKGELEPFDLSGKVTGLILSLLRQRVEASLLTKAEMQAINDAQPPEAKYGDVFEAIAQAQIQAILRILE